MATSAVAAPVSAPAAASAPQQNPAGIFSGNAEGTGFSGLLENPIFLTFLAEFGANLDPNGLGGALGKATSNAIRAKSTSKALGKSSKNTNTKMDAILNALKEDNRTINSVNFHPDGGIKSIGSVEKTIDSTPDISTRIAPPSGGAISGGAITDQVDNVDATNLNALYNRLGLGG